MEEQGEFEADIDHVNDSMITDEQWETEGELQHPWVSFNEDADNYDNLILDMNEPLGIAYPKLLLISFATNWADEMDIEGHYVATVDQYKTFKEELKEYFKDRDNDELYYGVGSNQGIEYSSYEDVMDCYESTPITKKEHQILVKLGLESAGFTGPEIEE